MTTLFTTRLTHLSTLDSEPDTWVIAWGNSLADRQFVKHHDPRLLFLPAQDIDDHQLNLLEQVLADYFPSITMPVLNSKLGHLLRGTNFPWNPPLKSDAEQVVMFAAHALSCKCKTLIVACEYGRSRSVATAHFIRDKFGLSYENERIGSKRIRRLLDNIKSPLQLNI